MIKAAGRVYWFCLLILVLSQGCGIYSLGGAKVPDQMKTVNVQFFENNAPLVVPTLSQQFTEALKDRIRNQSRLSIVRTEGDAIFEGRITDYSIKPTSIGSNDRAGQVRVTITVSVKYTNSLEETQSFEESFSAFKDVSIEGRTLESQQATIITDVNRQLTELIFNRAFANW